MLKIKREVKTIGYVYRFLDNEDTVLYIGFTTQKLKNRMYQHFNHGHLDDFVYNSTYKIQYFEDNNNANGRIYELAAINTYGSLFNKDGNYMQQSTIINDILKQKEWIDLDFNINKYINNEKDNNIKPKDEKLIEMLENNDYYINNLLGIANEIKNFDFNKMQESLYYIADHLPSIINIPQALTTYLYILSDEHNKMKNVIKAKIK